MRDMIAQMESYEEFCQARLAQIKAKVKLEKSSLPTTNNCRGSLIRFCGTAILPPMLSPAERKEIQRLQLKVMHNSETVKEKLHKSQTNMQILEIDTAQLIEVSSVKDSPEDYSFLMLPDMSVNKGPVKEMNSGCIKDSNLTTVHKTSHGHNQPQIFDPPVAQLSHDIEEIYTTNLMTDPVPVLMRSDLIDENVSSHPASFSCLGLVASDSTRAKNHNKNGPKSDDPQKAVPHPLQNVTVHKITDATKHKANNSINNQDNVYGIESDGWIEKPTGDKTNSHNSECLHHPTDRPHVSQNSSPDTPALSLQSLLKKSREYRDRQRQSKLLKTLQLNIPGETLSDKENELDAIKVGKNIRGKRNDSGKTMLPETTLKPEPARPSVFLPCSHTFSEHDQTFITCDVNTGGSNLGLHKLPKENKAAKIIEVVPKNNLKSSKPFKMIRKCSCSKRSPVQLNAAEEVPQGQEGGDNLSGSAKIQNGGFMVPKLTLSKSPEFSKKCIRPSQMLLVSTPISVSREKSEQQRHRGSCSDTAGDRAKINQAPTQCVADLGVNQANPKALTIGLQTALASSCEVERNEQLLNNEAATLQRNSDSLRIMYTQEDDGSTDAAVVDLHWNKGHNDLRFLSHENSIPQAVNSAPAAFHANKLQSFVTQEIRRPSQLLLVQCAPTITAPQVVSLKSTIHKTADRTSENQTITSRCCDMDSPFPLWTQDFNLKQEVDNSKTSTTPELVLNQLDCRVKRKLFLDTASSGQEQQPVSLTGSSKVSLQLQN
ncbi:uncharacterized protein LOC119953618 isoform X2 [Scyliorhinus canicula]|uniref:uncharacterized protein LOC119953618 isoform X2 n=1 Tax=Scyliorhinus canicula TaxID=7830 RepID=UPI0018F5A3DF|nr:uncharacterized protein LOC119953618 isoform X2 [Scyliorhinus canicula]